MKPTAEQMQAQRYFAGGSSLAIEAGAGTGKTSTLLMLAESTDRSGQYVAFNKAIVVEADAKFPLPKVSCRTAHSLAFAAVGHRYKHRLNSKRMLSEEIAAALQIDPLVVRGIDGTERVLSAAYLASVAMRAVTRFCQGVDEIPDGRHVPYLDGLDPITDGQRSYDTNRVVRRWLEPAIQSAWVDLMNLNGRLPFRHEHYLKAWQLTDAKIRADYILFDEAQDASPVMVDVVARQTHAQVVWVGDSQQQIYSFTGAVNALAAVPADRRTFLTQSFRFGPEIAAVANTLLSVLDADLRIVGTPSVPSTVGPIPEPDCILTRTNACAVRTLLERQNGGRSVCLLGGADDIVRFAEAAEKLMLGRRVSHPELACFSSWREVKAYVAEDEQGGDLKLMVALVEEFGVPTILMALSRATQERHADVVVSTAHKAKGREWNRVQLGPDFPDAPNDEETRLLYVACTRARLELDISAVGFLRDLC